MVAIFYDVGFTNYLGDKNDGPLEFFRYFLSFAVINVVVCVAVDCCPLLLLEMAWRLETQCWAMDDSGECDLVLVCEFTHFWTPIRTLPVTKRPDIVNCVSL